MPETFLIVIRAGTGGDEAALFARDLFDMYSTFAESKKWKVKTTETSPTDLGGYKLVGFEISGNQAWQLLQHEGGVHRVQRIPSTEKGGRVHTSTVTIAVFPQKVSQTFEITPADLEIEFFRSSGPGGQNVNKRETAVRIIHTPTGVTVESQEERSQQANRERAMATLESRIQEAMRERQAAQEQVVRKEQVGTGERAEKIRTYNFPQNRLTDHRIGKSWHNLDHIMKGKLGKVLQQVSQGLAPDDK